MNTCQHCSYKWEPKSLDVRSPVCPNRKCQSARWDKPTRKGPSRYEVQCIEDVLRHVKVTASGCWEWQGLRTSHGYGIAVFNGVRVGAHRIVLRFTLGQMPSSDTFSCHKCDNPPCCNPDHLFTGDGSVNMRDCVSKGRHKQHAAKFCKNGHAREPENIYTYSRPGGHIDWPCKQCARARNRAYKAKVRAQRVAK